MVNEETYSGLKTVYVAQGMLRATVIRGALESAGIPVMLSYEAIGPVMGITINGIGKVKVKVPNEWENEARDLLNARPPTGEIFTVPSDVQGPAAQS